jgi:hypothetical protein
VSSRAFELVRAGAAVSMLDIPEKRFLEYPSPFMAEGAKTEGDDCAMSQIMDTEVPGDDNQRAYPHLVIQMITEIDGKENKSSGGG